MQALFLSLDRGLLSSTVPTSAFVSEFMHNNTFPKFVLLEARFFVGWDRIPSVSLFSRDRNAVQVPLVGGLSGGGGVSSMAVASPRWD